MISSIKVALIGAGSQSFSPAIVRDLFLSEVLSENTITLVLMDKVAEHLHEIEFYGDYLNQELGRNINIIVTDQLRPALDGADAIITAIEKDRYLYWAQDFHIARKYGFKQIFGENGGPGGLFHALRNMTPMLEIARMMEQVCPNAILLNFTNPEHKICEALTRLTSIKTIGLCHGILAAIKQLSMILDIPCEYLDTAACGINHFTWFQRIRDRRTGEDLYPKLRQVEQKGDWLSDWDEIALSRILFRRFGLWPSPGTNHNGEYIRWAEDFWIPQLQYFYDPADGRPWENNPIPEFVYTITGRFTPQPWPRHWGEHPNPTLPMKEHTLEKSREIAIPIIEAVLCGVKRELNAINVPNHGYIPNLPNQSVVEVPAVADSAGIHPQQMAPLPEAIAAMLRLHLSIHQLLVESFAERSKTKLLQAVLLDPNVTTYRNAVDYVDEMLKLQRELLPAFG